MSSNMVVHKGGAAAAAAPVEASRAFEPANISEGFRLAEILVSSRLLPRGVSSPEAAFAIIASGRELGLTAMQSLRSIHIIEGKPTLSADLVAALCKARRDVCAWFRLVESTDAVATYETQRVGEPQPTRMSFSIEDARRAGVTGKDPWKKYPSAMLRARCITALARAVYPDLVMGVYDPDEVTPEPVNAGPAEVVREAPTQDGGEFHRLSVAVDAAITAPELNAIARGTAAAARAGRISAGQLEAIKGAVVRKRERMTAPAPASAPQVVADVGEVVEDEAAMEAFRPEAEQ